METPDQAQGLSKRKQDHIELAFKSNLNKNHLDNRFYYEPLLSPHPLQNSLTTHFLHFKLQLPIWVSSMTGGTEMANTINHNLARACGEFGMGMGLGSCRILLEDDTYLKDFDVRHLIGEQLPFFGNLGIAQLEELIADRRLYRLDELVDKLQLDGMIIHVNPLQEALQPEGDHFNKAPIDSIVDLLDHASYPVIVKEVGQGMGRESLGALLKLPIAAIDFAAAGGTNFAKLELLRNQDPSLEVLAKVGHSAEEMVAMVNELLMELGDQILCRQLIISGGIRNYLDGYYHMQKAGLPSIYAMASAFLKHAQGDYETLRSFIEREARGLALAQAFLRVR